MPVHNGYNVGAFVMNVLTSVLLILANKVVMSSEGYGFFFAVTLSSLHFIVAGMAMQLYSTMGFVKSGPSVPLKDKVIFVATADFSIIFLNSSLLLNTVGFYQISKLLVIPFVCLVDKFWLGKEFTGQRVFSIVVTVVGVAIVTVSDFSVNTFGMIIAMCSVVAAGMQQILCGEIQRRNRVSSVEMLLATAWPQGLSLMVVGPWLDRGFSGHWVQEYVLTAGATAMIGVTCLLAVGVNISQFITLGRFSATAYQVMGHSKTVLVLICGFLFFEESINPRQAGGMLLAVVGMVLYGAFSVRERKSETQPLALAPSSSSEEPAPVSPLLQVIQDASRRHPQTSV